ncbi:MAG TPA: glycoside hydrolase family 3 N-terminal domain-containing protein, partial [Candidatus Binatia bacterium]|nr:glycoside hydrolase family 3 N-terminal domain-containing protein [Candidatus Binatia bacterium]
DVDSNPKNPVIGDRSFGCDPKEVIRFAQPWMRGLRDGGIIPCAKHFPGHGDTDKDSHFDLPVVEKPLAELKRVELPPFVQACTDGIESLMTAHVLFRSLDESRPATLSQAIIGGLLRQELGYDGLVYSDDMEMKAISDNYGPEAVLLAVRAGIDMLLYGHELARAVDAFELLCAEAERDPLLLSRVEQSQRRIARLKQCFLKTLTATADHEVEEKLRQLDHRSIVEQCHGSR